MLQLQGRDDAAYQASPALEVPSPLAITAVRSSVDPLMTLACTTRKSSHTHVPNFNISLQGGEQGPDVYSAFKASDHELTLRSIGASPCRLLCLVGLSRRGGYCEDTGWSLCPAV